MGDGIDKGDETAGIIETFEVTCGPSIGGVAYRCCCCWYCCDCWLYIWLAADGFICCPYCCDEDAMIVDFKNYLFLLLFNKGK